MRASRARFALGIAVAGALAAAGAAAATGDDDRGRGGGHGPAVFRTQLTGYEEVAAASQTTPAIAAISTTGNGFFRAAVSRDRESVSWALQYSELEGNVLQAHIHFGQRHTAGGISVFLCTNLANAPAPPAQPTAACPPPPATITGTFTADDVIGPTAQGIEPGAFEELVRAMEAGTTYANVHSSKWPSGEIRGQIGFGRDRGWGW